MKTLITGGTGFIGSCLSRLIPDATVLDFIPPELSKTEEESYHVHWYDADLCEPMEGIQEYDVIYHLAALTSVQESIKYPDLYLRVNVDGTKNLLNHLAPHQRIIFASTAAAFEPKSPYDRSKAQAEKIVLLHNKNHSAVRIYNVFGKG